MREVTVLEKLHEIIGGIQMLHAVLENDIKLGGRVSEQLDGCVQGLIDVEAVLRLRDDGLINVTRLKIGMPSAGELDEQK